MSKPNGITARKKNLSISVWSADNGIGVELKSVRKKQGKALEHCFERGDFTQFKFGLERETALGLMQCLQQVILKDINLNPEKWEEVINE
jgi:hypothetical protein